MEQVQVVAADDDAGADLSGAELHIEESRDDLDTVRRSVSGRTHAWYCCLGSMLGFVGFGLTLISAIADVCHNPEGNQEDGVLPRWPSTVSEINSDFGSGRGRLFFGFMLATSGFLFAAQMPTSLDTPQFENELWKLGVAVRGSADERNGKWREVRLPDKYLLHFRSMAAPLGALFVALCPTVNFWTAHHAGQEVVRSVHLVAAGFLFLGGTGAEVWRLLRLHSVWKWKDAFSTHCTQCRRQAVAGPKTGRTTKQFFLNEAIVSSKLQGKQQPVGPIRPFLILCLCLNMLAIGPDLYIDSGAKPVITAFRGDIILSPTATGYCPGRQFRYAKISTREQCHSISKLLSHRFEARSNSQSSDPHNRNEVWRQGSRQTHSIGIETNASKACYVDFADVDSAGTGAKIETDLLLRTRTDEPAQYSAEGACAMLSNFDANATACVPMSDLTCRSKIILPRVIALCVCHPEDCSTGEENCQCRWGDTSKSSLRLRIFILESSLTVLLLFNYITIALEHEIQVAEAQVDADSVPQSMHARKRTFVCYHGFTYTRVISFLAVFILHCALNNLRFATALTRVDTEQIMFVVIALAVVITLCATGGLSSHEVSEIGRWRFLHVLRAAMMCCVYLAIAEAQSVFIEIRQEQEEQQDDAYTGQFSHWIGEDRVAHLLVRAFGTHGYVFDSSKSEDLRFGLIFSAQRCIALVISVVVVADAADKFTAIANCCDWIKNVAKGYGWKQNCTGKYERAAPSDCEMERDGGGDGAADTSLEASVDASAQCARSDT